MTAGLMGFKMNTFFILPWYGFSLNEKTQNYCALFCLLYLIAMFCFLHTESIHKCLWNARGKR